MFLNRKEQIAVLVLCGTLGVGAVVSHLKNRYPDRVSDFGVVKEAVPVPREVLSAADTSAAPDSARTTVGQVDLNRASAGDLERLPRIGPALAGRIVDHRARHGPFKRVEDLKNVKGVGEKTLERLRPYLKVGE